MEDSDNGLKLNVDKFPLEQKHSTKYLIILTVILGLAHSLDEYTSLAPGMIQSSLIQEFFINYGVSEQDALQIMSLLGLVTIFLLFAILPYKGLMDKFGRKKIFIIAIIGMTLGVAIGATAPIYPIYYVGSIIASFFILNDMQYVYINEEAPSHLRTQAFTSAKIIGLLALLIVPLIRQFSITETVENWRPILYFPFFLGIVVLILSLLFLKESRAFVILKEDRKLHPDKYVKEKLNFRQASRDFKVMPTWKQYKILIIHGVIWTFFALANGTNEVFMDQAGILQSDKNIVFTISTICVGIAYFSNGQFADRVGRKPAMVVNSTLVVLLLPLEFFAILNYNLWLAGIAQGLRIGAFWNSGDVRGIMVMENTPTRLRGFAQMYAGLWAFIPVILSVLLNTLLLEFVTYTMEISLIFGIPVNLACAIIAFWKFKETKHVDITQIQG
ncbi:MAG: MFS transporter [Candidatus Hermodarchaeota archaeon]